ncbi:MAG: hypothetical protein HRT45_09120 [Bdellovibrionales bacterium]|nr:hypothetical protein [Bdellovibrionales bacterium]
MTTKSHSVIGFALFGILSLIVFQGCGNYQAANTTGSGDFSNDSLFLTSLNQDGLVCPSNAMGITCGEEQVLTEISNDFGCNYMACANTSAAPLAALSPAEQVTCPDTLTPSCSSNQTVRVTVDRFGCEIKTCANDDGTDNPIEAMQQSLQTDDFKAPLGHKTALITDATGTRQALVPRFCGGMTYDDYLADSQICQGLGEK